MSSLNFFCLILIILLGAGAADVPECTGTVQFNPPKNLDTLIWYPTNSSVVPTFPMNYECLYQINVPQGWSSYIELKFLPTTNTTANNSVVQVIDFNQRVEKLDFTLVYLECTRCIFSIYYTGYDQFYFIAPGGRIKISTKDTSAQFQFSVLWFSEINPGSYDYANVTELDTQPYVSNYLFKGNQVTAETRVSIITIPPSESYLLETHLKALRSILIFDGPSVNSTCLGTALQLLNSNRQYVTSGRVVTVIPLRPLSYWSDSQLMFQDFENTKDITEYRGVACQGYCDPIVMDGSKTPSAFSTFSPYGYANDCLMSVSGTGNLDVYYGGKTDSKSNLIASYSEASNELMLPQLLRGVVRTYVLTGGIATVNITHNYDICLTIKKNQKGFITSRDYKTNLNLTYRGDWISIYSNSLYKYTFKIQDVDLSQNNSLQLSIIDNKSSVYDIVYNATNLPSLNESVSAVGTEWDIKYSGDYDNIKKGFYINYDVVKVNLAPSYLFNFVVTAVSIRFFLCMLF
ncbi:hypothetical protein CRE_11397 [Caenorhabditis remanei]|uniref:Uncharacterized protein n=1 Tax=Caenorhabditis remanei TaxID=31234 RepID=E3N733_CAERE|nr:hypothetical protein CRE_11397 [Caenorhabditis remanei]